MSVSAILAGVQAGARTSAQVVQEPAEHLLAVRRVHHLRVVLNAGQPAGTVSEGRNRRARQLDATTSKPAGATVTASPWLIHTGWISGRPGNAVPRQRH